MHRPSTFGTDGGPQPFMVTYEQESLRDHIYIYIHVQILY